MTDLTLLLATANLIPEATAARLRAALLAVTGGRYPIISVSQAPIDFGHNICVGQIGANKYNSYRQLFIGAQTVETEYVATVDDDTLYSASHFEHRPPPGVFVYETNYWLALEERTRYWRIADRETRGGGMWGCVALAESLCVNLAARFAAFPDPAAPLPPWWGEPGVTNGDQQYGRRDKLLRVSSPDPCVVFVHKASMGYTQFSRFHRRYGWPTSENTADSLPGFGSLPDLWTRYWSVDEPARLDSVPA